MADVPDLQTVDDTLWTAASARLTQTRWAYLRWTGGRLWGRPDTRLDSRYLLTGLSACGLCGGSLGVKARRPGTGPLEYRCVYHATRGPGGVRTPLAAGPCEVCGRPLSGRRLWPGA